VREGNNIASIWRQISIAGTLVVRSQDQAAKGSDDFGQLGHICYFLFQLSRRPLYAISGAMIQYCALVGGLNDGVFLASPSKKGSYSFAWMKWHSHVLIFFICRPREKQ